MSLALCPQVVPLAHQQFRSSGTQATCDGCFARQSLYLVISFTQACPGQHTHRSFRKWMSTIDTVQSSLGFPLRFLQQAHWICEDGGLRGLTVTSGGNPAEDMGDCFHCHCQAEGGSSTAEEKSDHEFIYLPLLKSIPSTVAMRMIFKPASGVANLTSVCA